MTTGPSSHVTRRAASYGPPRAYAYLIHTLVLTGGMRLRVPGVLTRRYGGIRRGRRSGGSGRTRRGRYPHPPTYKLRATVLEYVLDISLL